MSRCVTSTPRRVFFSPMEYHPSSPNKLQRRCPRLGSEVAFDYCLKHASEESPCFKICDCWWERFDVVEYLKQTLGPEAVQTLQASTPPPKVASLIELIQEAQERCGVLPSDYNKKSNNTT